MDWNCWFPHSNQPSTFAPVLAPALALDSISLCSLLPRKWATAEPAPQTTQIPHFLPVLTSCSHLTWLLQSQWSSQRFKAGRHLPMPAPTPAFPSCTQQAIYPSLYLWTWTCLPHRLTSILAHAEAGKRNLFPAGHISAKYTPFSTSGWVVKNQSWSLPLVCLRLLTQSFSWILRLLPVQHDFPISEQSVMDDLKQPGDHHGGQWVPQLTTCPMQD